jgi:hypothetical protein
MIHSSALSYDIDDVVNRTTPGFRHYGREYDGLVAKYDQSPLEVSFRQMVGALPADELTHSLYPYPARLLRHIPRMLLATPQITQGISRVIDPFCGSGTILLEGSQRGLNASGIDQNPIASLISRVKTAPVDLDATAMFLRSIKDRSKSSRSKYVAPSYLASWYDASSFSALQRIAKQLQDVENTPVTDVARVVLALVARRVAVTDKRIPVPVRPKPVSEPIATAGVWEVWDKESDNVLSKLARIKPSKTQVRVISGDARDASAWMLADATKPFMVMTSPPYGAAQKYIRSTSLESGWLGYSGPTGTRNLESSSIGREHMTKADEKVSRSVGIAEPFLERIEQNNPSRALIYRTYFEDMATVFSKFADNEACRRVVLITGTNSVTGIEVPTYDILGRDLLTRGFKRKLSLRDPIRGRSLLTRRNNKDAPTKAEYIEVFERE